MSLWNDVRYGFGQMRRTPMATAAAVMAVAVAIGACSTMFSTVDGFLWKTPPFPNGSRLVAFHERNAAAADFIRFQFSPVVFDRWREASTKLERISGFSYESSAMGVGQQGREPVTHSRVTGEFFLSLGTGAAQGRVLMPEDDRDGAAKVAVISHGLWKRSFASDAGILSKTLDLNGVRYQIAGVMPEGFGYPYASDLWTPFALNAEQRQSLEGKMHGFALLRAGASAEDAALELRAVSQRLASEFPKEQGSRSPVLGPFREISNGAITKQYSLMSLWGCMFVLLIACVNVANLQFAQASSRRNEISTRMALGASSGEILRLLVVQSVLITVCGGVIGLALGAWWLDMVRSGMPPEVARYILGWYEISLDHRAVGFTLALAALSGVMAGLLPALKAGHWNVASNLREAGRSATGSRASSRIKSVLVVAQLALVILLLTGAGLMIKGFGALVEKAKAFAPERVLFAGVDLPPNTPHGQVQESYRKLEAALRESSPDASIAMVDAAPFTQRRAILPFRWNRDASAVARPTAGVTWASPAFLEIAGGRLIAGRWFDQTDGAKTVPVVVASESFVKRFGEGREVVGRELLLDEDTEPVRIVGVVSDIPWDSFSAFGTALYRPFVQGADRSADLLVRVRGAEDPVKLAPAVRAALRKVDPDAVLRSTRRLAIVIRDERVGLAYIASTLGVLGLIALVLSSVGVYALVAFTVTERMKEFGVRMALGATSGVLVRMVLGGGLKLALIGLAVGVPASWMLTQAISGLLPGVEAHDPAVFGGTIAGLLALVLLASFGPAKRVGELAPGSVLNR